MARSVACVGRGGVAQGGVSCQLEHGVAFPVLAFASGVAIIVEFDDGDDVQFLAAQDESGHLAAETVAVCPPFAVTGRKTPLVPAPCIPAKLPAAGGASAARAPS